MKGQTYRISDAVITSDQNVPTQGSSVDLLAITAAAIVPFFVHHAQLNCAVNAAQIQKGSWVYRSTAGSGAAGSLGVRNVSMAGPAASLSANFLVGSPGALSGTPAWCEDWQQFGGHEVDFRDDPELVPSAITLAFNMPVVSVGFTCNINMLVPEAK